MNNLDELDKVLETHNLPRWNHEEIENLNRLITNKKIESIIKKQPTKKSQQINYSQVNSNNIFKIIKLIFLKLFRKLIRREHFITHPMRPALPPYESKTKTLYEKTITDKSLRIMDAKILKRILANRI